MSDDFGLFEAAGSLSAGEMAAGYTAYKAYGRVQPFIQGAINAGQGAALGADIGRAAVKTAATRAIAATAARTAATAGVSVAAGIEAGATTGTAIAPGVGTAIGAVAGAVAPFIVPHIPVVGDAVNKIPLVGEILSPSKKKAESSSGGLGGGAWSEQNPHLQTPGQNVMANRADYLAGRGFRK